jgi:hypothetical protein
MTTMVLHRTYLRVQPGVPMQKPFGQFKKKPTGAHDCAPLTSSQFMGGVQSVGRALMSAVVVPQSLFEGIPLTGAMAEDEKKIALLAIFAHFKSAPLTMTFWFRYQAMLALRDAPQLKPWLFHQGDETERCTVFHPAMMTTAASLKLQPTFTFDVEAFVAACRAASDGFTPDQAVDQGRVTTAANDQAEADRERAIA